MEELQALKAQAYDMIALKERAENNLREINQRIYLLSQRGEVKQEEETGQGEKVVPESEEAV